VDQVLTSEGNRVKVYNRLSNPSDIREDNAVVDRKKHQRRSKESHEEVLDREHLADLALRGPMNLVNRPPDSPNRYYAVRVDRVPGVYDIWEEAERQVTGFRGNEHARFDNKQDAVRYMRQKFANTSNIPLPTKASDQHSAESKASDVEDFFGDGDSYGGEDSNNQGWSS
jgi:hypothetical protein